MATELLDFWIIIVFSLLGVLLATRLGLPSVLGVLLFGSLIGPNALGLVKGTETISLLAELGAILLLFFIGIEFNLDKIAKYGLRATLVFILKFGVVFLITYITALLMDFTIFDALVLGVILSFSSTAIFARLISDAILHDQEESRLMGAVLILEDVVAIFMLTLLSQMRSSAALSLTSIVLSTMVSLLVLSFSYVVLRWLVQHLSLWLEEKNIEAQLFSALSLCALLASLAAAFGLSPSIGAFLAGSVFSSIPVFRRIEHALYQLILLFSAFFFFSIGMLVNPVFLLASFGILLVFGSINLLAKFLSVSLSTYLLGFESRSAVFSALLMLTVSEFALLIAVQTTPFSSFDFVSFSAALMFLSTLGTALLYPREASINAWLSARAPAGAKTPLKNLSLYMGDLIRRFEPGGSFYEAFIAHSSQLLFYIALFILINSAVFVAKEYFLPFLAFLHYPVGPLDTLKIAALVLSLYPLYRILQILHILLGEFTEAFHGVDKNHLNLQHRMVADALFFFLFFGLSFGIPLVLSMLSLPRFLYPLSILPLFVSFAFVWDLAHQATTLLKLLGGKVKRR